MSWSALGGLTGIVRLQTFERRGAARSTRLIGERSRRYVNALPRCGSLANRRTGQPGLPSGRPPRRPPGLAQRTPRDDDSLSPGVISAVGQWGKPRCKPVNCVAVSYWAPMPSEIVRFDSKSGAGQPVAGSTPVPSALTISARQCQTPCPARGFVFCLSNRPHPPD